MDVVTDIDEMRLVSERKRAEGKTVGFVPTMGAVHEGHLSLVRRARELSDFVVVSIFVNPTQFSPGEDFRKYPRDLESDARAIESVGADLIFAPESRDMYPGGYATYIIVENLTKELCGHSRPTHFRGVTTVVAKLFAIVNPHMAVFGQKDAQQVAVVKRMVRDLNIPVTIEVSPVVREPDGLAMSSRNRYLTPEQRSSATVLYRSLCLAADSVASGVTSSNDIIRKVRSTIRKTDGAKIDYVYIVDPDEISHVERIGENALLAVAVWFGKTRLIDNIVLHGKKG
ncbi:pantoate--beta-alanine ligase [bacterium]|nr:pantoate--beta-alanine ligase [bacterium]